MSDNRDNEMEQIQRGLEAFLEKEINLSDTGNTGIGNRRKTEGFPEDASGAEGRMRDAYAEEDDTYFEEGAYAEEEVYPKSRTQLDMGSGKGRYETGRDGSLAYEDYGEYREPQGRPRQDKGRGRSRYEIEADREMTRRGYSEYDDYEEDEAFSGEARMYEDAQGDESEDWDAPGRRAPVRKRARQAGEAERYYEESPMRRSRRGTYEEIPQDRRPRREAYEEIPEERQARRREREEDKGRKRFAEEELPKRRKGPGKAGQEDSEMAHKKPGAQKAQKKKRKKKHRLLKLLIVAVLLLAVLGVGAYKLVGTVYGKMNYREIASVAGAPMQEDGVVNILLIGNDSRENGEDGRSDAMILLSISSKTKKIYMTSLLRDMYVDIPGHDGNRLNAAYSFGGAELLMETIEKNFDISVNRYILVNFEAFAGLVDAVDGIELELSSEEIEYINAYLVEYNVLTDRPQGTDNMDTSVSGLVHLNGPQALAYSRNRYLGTDFGRTDRQRKVLTAVIKKLPSAMVGNAKGLLDGLMPNLTTNLTQNECFRLSLMAGKFLTYDIEADSIPQPGTYRDVTIRKMAVLEVDFDTNIKYLKDKLYGGQED